MTMSTKKTQRQRSEFSRSLDQMEIDEAEINHFLEFDNWYDHYQAMKIMKHHLYLFKKASESNDDRGMLDFVIGDYNTGKSTLELQWMYDMQTSDRYQIKPSEIIYFEVPPGTKSDKLLFAKLLERQFGQKFGLNELKNHITTVDILDRLIENFKIHDTKVVIFDEIQLLLENPLTKRIFNNLKYLMNFSKWGRTSVKTNWILCGTEDSQKLLRIEDWIHERTNVLRLNSYNTQIKDDRKEIMKVITMIWKDWTDNGWFDPNEWRLVVKEGNRYKQDTESISKLHQMSDGKIGKLYQIMKKAGWWALMDGRRHITEEDYVEGAFIQEKEFKVSSKVNPTPNEKIDRSLTDNSVLKLQMEDSIISGICMFCQNKHRGGNVYTTPKGLKDHYEKSHKDKIRKY